MTRVALTSQRGSQTAERDDMEREAQVLRDDVRRLRESRDTLMQQRTEEMKAEEAAAAAKVCVVLCGGLCVALSCTRRRTHANTRTHTHAERVRQPAAGAGGDAR